MLRQILELSKTVLHVLSLTAHFVARLFPVNERIRVLAPRRRGGRRHALVWYRARARRGHRRRAARAAPRRQASHSVTAVSYTLYNQRLEFPGYSVVASVFEKI